MAELPRSVIIDPAVLAERRARRAGAQPEPPPPFGGAPQPEPTAPPPFAGPAPRPAPPPPAWTAPPPAPRPAGRLVAAEQLWRERREALERELAGAAAALTRVREDERAAREAVFAALESARAELRAVRAARAADQSTLMTLRAELDAERIAHAVARATNARLRVQLAAALAAAAPPTALVAAPAAPEEPPANLAPEEPAANLAPEVLTTPATPDRPPPERAEALPAVVAGDLTPPELVRPGGLADAARAQVAAAAAAERRPAERLLADLDAAAKALRGTADERHLRRALVALAREDPSAAGRWLVALLPAQTAVLEDPPSYDLTIQGLGTYAVTGADVRRILRPRSRHQARFHLRADAAALAELLAGEDVRIGRFRGRARARRRARVTALQPLAGAQLSLADAFKAGARLDPALVFAALPFAIPPDWTEGHEFTVAQEITDHVSRTWYVTARDGARLAVSATAPGPPDATIEMSRRAFEALLRGEPSFDLPTVRGDRAAVAALKAWTERARGV